MWRSHAIQQFPLTSSLLGNLTSFFGSSGTIISLSVNLCRYIPLFKVFRHTTDLYFKSKLETFCSLTLSIQFETNDNRDLIPFTAFFMQEISEHSCLLLEMLLFGAMPSHWYVDMPSLSIVNYAKCKVLCYLTS